MNDNDLLRLRHMRDAAREAISFAQGRSSHDLKLDRMFLLSVVKEIEIVGEAASRISPQGRSEAPGIAWEKITGMRNRLIHAYFDWDLEAIWSSLTNNLPELLNELEKTLPPEA